MEKNYKILIVGEVKNKIEGIEGQNCKEIPKSIAKKVINKEDFDFLYICDSDKEIMQKFKEYILLPEILNKFSINQDAKNTYIHNNFLNKIIMNNVEIIQTKDEVEEVTLRFILEKIICKNERKVELQSIISEMKKFYGKININALISKIIIRDYTQGSKSRLIEYFENSKNIKLKFFSNLINNIENDIERAKGFQNLKVNRIEVY